MLKKNKTLKIRATAKPSKPSQKPSQQKASPIKPPTYPLFLRIGIFSQRQCRALLARILKLLLNGDLPESRVREARWVLNLAVEINRELSLRARLDAVCEHLKIDPDSLGEDAEDEAPLPEELEAQPGLGREGADDEQD